MCQLLLAGCESNRKLRELPSAALFVVFKRAMWKGNGTHDRNEDITISFL